MFVRKNADKGTRHKKKFGRTIRVKLQVSNKCCLVNSIQNFWFCQYRRSPFFLWQLTVYIVIINLMPVGRMGASWFCGPFTPAIHTRSLDLLVLFCFYYHWQIVCIKISACVVCICAYEFVCVCAFVFVYICVCMHLCLYAFVFAYMYLCVCISFVRVCICVYAVVFVCVCKVGAHCKAKQKLALTVKPAVTGK